MTRVHIDIREGLHLGDAGTRELLGDLYLPEDAGDEPRAAVVLVFGGSWRSEGRLQQKGYGLALAKAGFVCLATDYRFSSEAVWPAQLDDVTTAVRWLRAHAADYSVDPNRIAVSGNSSGGHLALMVGAKAGSEVSAVCAFYPPTRLPGLDDQNGDDTVSALLGPDATDADYLDASPLSHVDQRFPPVLLMSGDADERVPVEHTYQLHDGLKAAGNTVELHVFAGLGHAFDSGPELARVTSSIMIAFFQRYA